GSRDARGAAGAAGIEAPADQRSRRVHRDRSRGKALDRRAAGGSGMASTAGRRARLEVTALRAVAGIAILLNAWGQTKSQASDPIPQFDAVSIKPCVGPSQAPFEGRGGGAGQTHFSPGRIHLDCMTLGGDRGLIRDAYGKFANGRMNAY